VLSSEYWVYDKNSEWFPVLAQRESVATVQGYEWVPGGVFDERQELHDKVQGCWYADVECIVHWRQASGVEYDYVYIPKHEWGQCCEGVVETLRTDSRFEQTYNGPGATIYRYLN
jgi:hypothetical protein